MLEPALIDAVDPATAVDIRQRFIDRGQQLVITLAHHAAVDLFRLRLTDHHPVMRITRLGSLAVEQRVVHIERGGPAGLEHHERLAMILGADDEGAQVVLQVVILQVLFIGGARSAHHILALQVIQSLDAAALLG